MAEPIQSTPRILRRKQVEARVGLKRSTLYERVAADSGAIALWEPLLVRAYLHEALAIVAPAPRLQRPAESASSDLRLRGVVGSSARVLMPPR